MGPRVGPVPPDPHGPHRRSLRTRTRTRYPPPPCNTSCCTSCCTDWHPLLYPHGFCCLFWLPSSLVKVTWAWAGAAAARICWSVVPRTIEAPSCRLQMAWACAAALSLFCAACFGCPRCACCRTCCTSCCTSCCTFAASPLHLLVHCICCTSNIKCKLPRVATTSCWCTSCCAAIPDSSRFPYLRESQSASKRKFSM